MNELTVGAPRMTLVGRRQDKKTLQLQLTMFSDRSLTESSEASGAEPKNKTIDAIILGPPPYLVDSRQARLTQMDSVLNDLQVEIHRLPITSRYIARLILDAFLEIRDALAQEGK
jgi:hypothetical protein